MPLTGTDGLSRWEAAKRFGVHRNTISKMLQFPIPPDYRRYGSTGGEEALPVYGVGSIRFGKTNAPFARSSAGTMYLKTAEANCTTEPALIAF